MESSPIVIAYIIDVQKDNGTVSKHAKIPVYIYQFVHRAYALCMAIEAPFTVLANLLLLLTIIYRRKLHTTDCYIIASLAVADMFLGVTEMPMDFIGNTPSLRYLLRSNRITCFSWRFVGSFGLCCSLNNLCLLSFERFIAINWPFHRDRWVTRERVIGVLLAMYFLEALRASLIFFVGTYNASASTPSSKCNYFLGMPMWFHIQLGLYKICLTLALGLIFCTQVTFVAYKQVLRIDQLVASTFPSTSERRVSKRGLASVRITTAVNYVFLVMWLPLQLQMPISRAVQMTKSSDEVFRVICLTILKTNSLMNPLLIVICRKSIREAFLFLLTSPPWKWSDVRYQVQDSSTETNTRPKPLTVLPKNEMPEKDMNVEQKKRDSGTNNADQILKPDKKYEK